MTDKPVLSTIRAILKFKNRTTISEIAQMAGMKRRDVLDVINKNGQFVWCDRRTGHITKVDPVSTQREQLWASGRFYRRGTYGAWSVEGYCLEFTGNEELRQRLSETKRLGAFGDSYEKAIVLDTDANRAALESAGLQDWEFVGLKQVDDRLWDE